MKKLFLLLPFLVVSFLFGDKPNIVLFFLDDFGVRDLSCYGSEFYETPHMDSMAKEGIMFKNAYSGYARCVPSRQALLSGKYPSRITGKKYKSNKERHALPLEEVTFGEALKEGGYQTCYIGKWHLGKEGGGPGAQGFDTVIHSGTAGAPASYFYPFPCEKGNTVENPVDGKEGDYLNDRLTDEALNYIEKQKSNPFLLVMAHYAVHTPLEAPEPLIEKYKKKLSGKGIAIGGEKDDADIVKDRSGYSKTIQNNPVYAGMVENVDMSLGRIMKKLEELGISDNTVIILSSDHGGLATRGLENNRPLATSNLPYRQGKGSAFDGGTRVPLIVKWPAKIKAGQVTEVQVTGTDHYPTMLEMAGLSLRPQQHVDGRSYMKALQGEQYQREGMFWYKWMARPDSTGDTRAISYIEGNYKVIEWLDEDMTELYDLSKDPGEHTDISSQMPEITNDLLAKLHKLEEEVGNQREAGAKYLEKRLKKAKKGKSSDH